MRHVDHPLTQQLDALLDSFRRLRRTEFWRRRVNAGAGFLEITFNETTRRFHPHLHVICSGRYLPRDELTLTWKHVTRGSFVIDIRFIRDQATTARYVAKYATKAISNTILNDHAACREALDALTGRKTIYAFGEWSHWKLLANPDDDTWEVFGWRDELVYLANCGDHQALAVLQAVQAAPGAEIFIPDVPPDPLEAALEP